MKAPGFAPSLPRANGAQRGPGSCKRLLGSALAMSLEARVDQEGTERDGGGKPSSKDRHRPPEPPLKHRINSPLPKEGQYDCRDKCNCAEGEDDPGEATSGCLQEEGCAECEPNPHGEVETRSRLPAQYSANDPSRCREPDDSHGGDEDTDENDEECHCLPRCLKVWRFSCGRAPQPR